MCDDFGDDGFGDTGDHHDDGLGGGEDHHHDTNHHDNHHDDNHKNNGHDCFGSGMMGDEGITPSENGDILPSGAKKNAKDAEKKIEKMEGKNTIVKVAIIAAVVIGGILGYNHWQKKHQQKQSKEASPQQAL